MGWWRTLAAAVVVLPLAGCAFSAVGRAPKNNGMGRPPSSVDVSEIGVREVEGKVVKVDSAAGRVLVEQDGQIVELQTEREATVFVDGSVGGLRDLHEGAQVRASFEENGGKRLVRWIEVPRTDEPAEAQEQKVPEEEKK